MAVRGTDSTVGLNFDVQGANTATFSSHSFGNTEFQIFGNGGSSWLTTGSDSFAAPSIASAGAATNIDIKLQPKGSGAVWLGGYTLTAPVATGYITVKDSSGNTRKLLCA